MARVLISMPERFLDEIDSLAENEKPHTFWINPGSTQDLYVQKSNS